MSFQIYCSVCLLVIKSFCFLCLKRSLFLLQFWKTFCQSILGWDIFYLFQHFQDATVDSCLHYFWVEIFYHSYFFPLNITFFSLAAVNIFSLELIWEKFHYDVTWVSICFCFLCLELLSFLGLWFYHIWENFAHYFFSSALPFWSIICRYRKLSILQWNSTLSTKAQFLSPPKPKHTHTQIQHYSIRIFLLG